MAEETTHNTTSLPGLDQLLGAIDATIINAADNQAHLLGSGLLARADLGAHGDTYILFVIGDTRLAVALADVVEVGDLPSMTRLPNLPDWLSGIINVRGEIVSVVDLARFLGWSVDGTFRHLRMVILRHGRVKTALQIDRVVGMHRQSERSDRLRPSPRTLGRAGDILPQRMNVGDQVYQVLECRALFTDVRFVGVSHE